MVNSIAANELPNLPINQFQLLGSHNSYKRPFDPDLYQFIQSKDAKRAADLNYAHATITEQLNTGLRQLEIDIVKDPKGGKFNEPAAEKWINKTLLTPEEERELNQPGFKVMHIPDIDFLSHCILFETCLKQLKLWSDQNPNHFPVFVLMNIKESQTRLLKGEPVLTFEQNDWREIDLVLNRVLKDKLFTPEHLIAGFNTVQQAIKNRGWPLLNDLKGKIVFIYDGNPKQVARYRSSLRADALPAMFASYSPKHPDAAIFIRNDPIKNAKEINKLTQAGFIVRTRSDAKPIDCETKNRQKANAAISSGAQIISTDCYPGSVLSEKYQFEVSLPERKFIRIINN